MKFTSFKEIPQFTSIGSYAVDYPLDYLVQWIDRSIEESHLDMNPAFQRSHVWTEDQQRAFIEFLLRGGRTGRDLFFNCPDWVRPVQKGDYNAFVCVDGLQRITAIQRFINNELPVFGSYYQEFTDRVPTLLSMRVHINDLKTEREVIQWYLEMNSGGTPHSPEELSRVRLMLDSLV